jgi:hypothetical protein
MRLEGRVLATVLAGCGGGASDLVMEDVNNYTQESDITFGHYPVVDGVDTTIDWSALTTDLRGRPLDPSTVDQVLFSKLEMTEDELRQRVLANDIPQAEAESATFGNGDHETSVALSELDAVGNPFDPANVVGDADHVWIVSLVETPEGTADQQILYTVAVDPGPAGGAVAITDGASSVNLLPNLHRDGAALHTVADERPYTLDWSGMTEDVFGNPFDNLVWNTLVLVNYGGSVSDAEGDFLLLDHHADAVYRLDVYGKESARLEEASDADGNAFPGFTTDGTWLVGLVDHASLSPVPLVMTVVEVE